MSRFDGIQFDEHAIRAHGELKNLFSAIERRVMDLRFTRERQETLTNLEASCLWLGKALKEDQILRELHEEKEGAPQ